MLILVNLADRRLALGHVEGVLLRALRQHRAMINFGLFYSPDLGAPARDGRPFSLAISFYTGDEASPSEMERVNALMRGWIDFREDD